MSELKPWIEDGAPEAVAELLDAARVEQPSDESLRRTLAAVGVGMVTASTSSAMAGVSGVSGVVETKASILLGAASAFKWMVVGAGLGAAVVAAVEEKRAPDRSVPVSVASSQGSSVARSTGSSGSFRRATATPGTAADVPRAEPASSALEPPKSVASSPRRRLTAPDEPPAGAPARVGPEMDSEQLAEEIRAIDDANRALASGRAAETLAALDDYDRRYPEHRFAPEALFLRMEALLRSGRAAEAHTIANRLVAAYPKSPQSARARVLLSQTIP
jgi:TolA-binding protein